MSRIFNFFIIKNQLIKKASQFIRLIFSIRFYGDYWKNVFTELITNLNFTWQDNFIENFFFFFFMQFLIALVLLLLWVIIFILWAQRNLIILFNGFVTSSSSIHNPCKSNKNKKKFKNLCKILKRSMEPLSTISTPSYLIQEARAPPRPLCYGHIN